MWPSIRHGIAANASRDRIDSEQARLRLTIRRWQKQCDAEDPDEGVGMEVDGEVLVELEPRSVDLNLVD
jgi:hypothetical protein